MDNYKGFTNYSTMLLAQRIKGDKQYCYYWREVAEEATEVLKEDLGANYKSRVAVYELSDQMQREIGEQIPVHEEGFYKDLLEASLSEINYYQIAEILIEEVS